MQNTLPWWRPLPVSRWRELAMPKEHGSWSLAAEPLALGLIVAPTAAGVSLAVAVAAGFLARRPLRIACMDARAGRRADARAVLAALALVAAAGFAGAVWLAGAGWIGWLLPTMAAGAVFLAFDLRNAGRDEVAEVAGAAAFAFLPAAFVAMAGATALTALAVALVMCGRAVPTVLCVRAALREARTGVRRVAPALIAAGAALAVAAIFHRSEIAPCAAVVLLAVLALRAAALLVFPRPALRARTIGMIEAILGVLFVILVGFTWTA